MDTLRPDPRRRAAIRDGIIDNFTLSEVLDRLAILAPNDLKDLELIARDVLRRRWPSSRDS